ncbi:hypothetical protein HDU96_003191 [Phlyctochytrium bullatum]|nr:hypothetical protein HDU96_003191 [Phlyctochytrium bullatum]
MRKQSASRMSVSTTASTIIGENKIRAPLAVFIVAVITVMTALYWPDYIYPVLRSPALIPGRPVYSDILWAAPTQTFIMHLVWPVWKDLAIGLAGTGPYWAGYAAHFSLRTISEFMETIRISQNGLVAIIEPKTGLMVSASVPGISQNGTTDKRFPAIGNPNGLVSSAASFLANTFGNGTIQSIPNDKKYDLSFRANGDDVLVNAAWIVDETKTLQWIIMVIIPSNDFLAGIKTTTSQTIIFVVCVCVTSILFAIGLSWAITAPLMRLVTAMVEATHFDFSALGEGYLKRRSVVNEIGKLQAVFNEMLVKFAGAIRNNKALVTGAPMSKATAQNDSTSLAKRASMLNDPAQTPFNGGVWKVHVELPDQYPYKSPSIGFVNKIFHPNIDEMSGSVCLDVINQTWSPMFDMINIFEVFLPQLLRYPNPTDPLNGEAAALLMREPQAYDAKVKEYVSKYATKEAADAAAEQSEPEDEMSSISDYSEEEAPGLEL